MTDNNPGVCPSCILTQTHTLQEEARQDERFRIASLIAQEGPWCSECRTYEFTIGLAMEGSTSNTVYRLAGFGNMEETAHRHGQELALGRVLRLLADRSAETEDPETQRLLEELAQTIQTELEPSVRQHAATVRRSATVCALCREPWPCSLAGVGL